MPEIDPLAFDIRFALIHKVKDPDLKKLIRSLGEQQLERLCGKVADHLRLANWRPGPPVPSGQIPLPLGNAAVSETIREIAARLQP